MTTLIKLLVFLCSLSQLAFCLPVRTDLSMIIVEAQGPEERADVENFASQLSGQVGQERVVGRVPFGSAGTLFLLEIGLGRVNSLVARFAHRPNRMTDTFESAATTGVEVRKPEAIGDRELLFVASLFQRGNFREVLSTFAVFHRLLRATPATTIEKLSVDARNAWARELVRWLGTIDGVLSAWTEACKARGRITLMDQIEQGGVSFTEDHVPAILHHMVTGPGALEMKSGFTSLVQALGEILHLLATPFSRNALLLNADLGSGSMKHSLFRHLNVYEDLWYELAESHLSPQGVSHVEQEFVRYRYSPSVRTVGTIVHFPNEDKMPSIEKALPLPVQMLAMSTRGKDRLIRFLFDTESRLAAVAGLFAGELGPGERLIDSTVEELGNLGRWIAFPLDTKAQFAAASASILGEILEGFVTPYLRRLAIDVSLTFIQHVEDPALGYKASPLAATAAKDLATKVRAAVSRYPQGKDFDCDDLLRAAGA